MFSKQSTLSYTNAAAMVIQQRGIDNFKLIKIQKLVQRDHFLIITKIRCCFKERKVFTSLREVV